jgi:hypothetical protein
LLELRFLVVFLGSPLACIRHSLVTYVNHDYALGFQFLRLVYSPVAEEMHRQPSSRPASLKEIKSKSPLLVALEYALITGKAPINTPNYK